MKKIAHSAIGAAAAALVLALTPLNSAGASAPGAERHEAASTPKVAAEPSVAVPLTAEPGSATDRLARQLMAPDLAADSRVGQPALVLVGTARLGGQRGADVLFVQLQSENECGSAGCSMVSFRNENGKWTRVLDTVGGTIRIAESTHRGMPDLIVNDRDRLIWDGSKYAGDA
jgi:hypothetical protein